MFILWKHAMHIQPETVPWHVIAFSRAAAAATREKMQQRGNFLRGQLFNDLLSCRIKCSCRNRRRLKENFARVAGEDEQRVVHKSKQQLHTVESVWASMKIMNNNLFFYICRCSSSSSESIAAVTQPAAQNAIEKQTQFSDDESLISPATAVVVSLSINENVLFKFRWQRKKKKRTYCVHLVCSACAFLMRNSHSHILQFA